MTQLRLSIACTCRCGEPDCPPCTAYTRTHRMGYVARRQEKRLAQEQQNHMRLIFRSLRAEAQVLHLGLRPEPRPFVDHRFAPFSGGVVV
jgi:hypothetical protein